MQFAYNLNLDSRTWVSLWQSWDEALRYDLYMLHVGRSACLSPYADGVDVWLVASEGLSAHSFSDVPELGRGIAGSRHKQPGVGCQRETHDITSVAGKCSCLLTSFNVPQSAARKHKERCQITAAFYRTTSFKKDADWWPKKQTCWI